LTDTLAEDMDLTWRLRELGYQQETESRAVAFTEAPDSIRSFFKQRFRWAYGTLQCLWKHKTSLGHHQWFGCFALPSLWLFQVIFNALAPFVDIQLVYSLFTYVNLWFTRQSHDNEFQPLNAADSSLKQVAFLYLLFFFVEAIAGTIAYRMEKRSAKDVVWLFFQRFVYRQLMYAVIYKSIATALAGARQGWGKIDRKATVSLPLADTLRKSHDRPIVERDV
jgi:cellulose synthase/poly-beta-1,6-N-acetylglucosamine synthase-like glycosyltransferase